MHIFCYFQGTSIDRNVVISEIHQREAKLSERTRARSRAHSPYGMQIVYKFIAQANNEQASHRIY